MPLYLYTCHTCELELEELYPLGQAPDRSIRCPLCGGWFERDVALVSTFRRLTVAENQPEKWSDRPLRHGANCVCCKPR